MAAAGNRTWRPKIEALAERVPSRLHLIWESEPRFQLIRPLGNSRLTRTDPAVVRRARYRRRRGLVPPSWLQRTGPTVAMHANALARRRCLSADRSAARRQIRVAAHRMPAIVAMSGTKHSLAKWPYYNYLLVDRVSADRLGLAALGVPD